MECLALLLVEGDLHGEIFTRTVECYTPKPTPPPVNWPTGGPSLASCNVPCEEVDCFHEFGEVYLREWLDGGLFL